MDDAADRDPAAGAGRAPSTAATLVGALAVAAVGVVFATGLPSLLLPTVLGEGVPAAPLRIGVLAPAVLAVTVAATVAQRRLGGWPLVPAGLLLAAVADRIAAAPPAMPAAAPGSGAALAVLLNAAGLGLALGGALLAVAAAPGRARAPLAGGLVVGLVAQPGYAALVPDARPFGPVPLHLFGLLVTAGAALLAYRRRTGVPGPTAGTSPRVPVAAVAAAGSLVLGGLLLRWWVTRAARGGPTGRCGPRCAALDAVDQHGPVALAVAAALVLLGYALRAFGVVGARWVVLGFAAAPLRLVAWHLDVGTAPGRVLLVAVTGLVAVAVGVTLARHAAGQLPWDALGVAVAAAALPLATPVVRVELPSAATVGPVLAALGLGLALGFGLTHLTSSAPTDRRVAATGASGADRDWLGGAGALGFATWTLTAQALAPVAVRPVGPADLPFTLPVLALAGAVVLAGLFATADRVTRLGR